MSGDDAARSKEQEDEPTKGPAGRLPDSGSDTHDEAGKEPDPAIWRPQAAGVAAAVLVVAVGFVTWWTLRIMGLVGGEGDGTPAFADGGLRLATAVATPLLIIGFVVLAAGIWMLTVEFVGRLVFIEDVERIARAAEGKLAARHALVSAKAGPSFSIGDALKEFGKLRGPLAILIVGLVPMLAAAWIAVAAVGDSAEANGTDDGDAEAVEPDADGPAET